MFEINKDSIKREKKYDKLLNNLLDIKVVDQCLFTKINGVDSFDITSKFGKKLSKVILSQKKFTSALNEIDLEKLLEIVKNSNNNLEIIAAYDKYKEKIFNTKKILLENPETFLKTKEELTEKLTEKIQKSNTRWTQFRRKVLDINIQENVWPLHVATFFISIKTLKREIYAPLILKEVNIEIKNSKIIISSDDEPWKINEKLLFIIKENGFSIDEKINFDELNAFDVINKIKQQINLNFDERIISENFKNFKKEDIKQKVLLEHPGVVLGMFKPTGGNIRKTMIEIIENDEIEEILDVEPDKNIYKDNIINFIKEKSHEIIRIQKSNFSQDKAIISSLIQDTIIWGPPGTGKSQVIANIIANILYQNKTAIVMSQKKAALDVLKKRLGKISSFVLFILNDNKMDKSEFYKPLKKFVELVENAGIFPYERRKKIISEEMIDALNLISTAKANKSYDSSLKIIEILKDDFNYFIRKIFMLDSNLKYPTSVLDIKNYIKELARINGINKKKLLFIKFYPKFLKVYAEIAITIINNSDFSINDLINLTKNTDYQTVIDLFNCAKIFNQKNKYESNEEFLEKLLANNTITTIKNWKTDSPVLLKEYKKFSSAVKAARRLPYKFLNDNINIIKKLFPVIVTTPETSFINWKKQYFDYAILDESSQMFLEVGLPILYLSKIKVLAGDPEQMQPSRWFSTRDDNESDEDVIENADSILDYSFDKGVHQIMLNQNFRSSTAALMSFSAKKFYESKLEVIDKIRRDKTDSIVVKSVNGKWENSVNKVEANVTIEITLQESKNYEKIIILTFNSAQRQLIEKMIIETEPELCALIESENLAVRNIENIQGDEADLVIISVVYDETTNIGSTYVAKPGFGKSALNVAVSRAKEKIIVIKSVTSSTIKTANSEDFLVFKDWLQFLDMPEKEKRKYSILEGTNEIVETYGETDSTFEREVIDEIKNKVKTIKKCKLMKQYEVGSKKIDIAFIDEQGSYLLGLEVDGYKYHDGMGFDKYLEDLSRQDFLESKGYNIYRIREIDWKINKNEVILNIQKILNNINKN